MTHQAVRNGAEEVLVCDLEKEDRIAPGKAYGYYTFDGESGMTISDTALQVSRFYQRPEHETVFTRSGWYRTTASGYPG